MTNFSTFGCDLDYRKRQLRDLVLEIERKKMQNFGLNFPVYFVGKEVADTEKRQVLVIQKCMF